MATLYLRRKGYEFPELLPGSGFESENPYKCKPVTLARTLLEPTLN